MLMSLPDPYPYLVPGRMGQLTAYPFGDADIAARGWRDTNYYFDIP